MWSFDGSLNKLLENKQLELPVIWDTVTVVWRHSQNTRLTSPSRVIYDVSSAKICDKIIVFRRSRTTLSYLASTIPMLRIITNNRNNHYKRVISPSDQYTLYIYTGVNLVCVFLIPCAEFQHINIVGLCLALFHRLHHVLHMCFHVHVPERASPIENTLNV